ncbi:AP endonuclease [Westerdykella ornata]|uniref:Apurinic-apyrimidinic endonuclease 1 n=1 Tax=Westerdykella ornata TaxID=318751 RepID=A0A6A6JEF9_WESOR|nr:AP endonuclease [Westerdykella ornata]KAF2274802.1 AP endonuclease [Westerdykella ornata]
MARKTFDSDSDLSSPPDENALAQQAEVAVTSEVVNGSSRKRKARTTVKTAKRARKTVISEDLANSDEEAEAEGETQTPSKGRARVSKVKDDEETIEHKITDGENGVTITKRKRQKRIKIEDLPPLQPRTVGSKLLVGAHISSAGGVHNAITNLVHIGSNAFALFLKSQRKWENPPLNPEHVTLFIDNCHKHNVEPGRCAVPHGSYLVNLAHPDKERKKQAYNSFHDDLTRCHKLGIKYYNFHPGNCNACTREEGIRLIAENINEAHKDPKTGEVMPLLETMATLGNTIGGTFKDLADIIELVEDKGRIGVCLDTCHVFAAGYDLRTPESFAKVMQEFDDVIGLKYLKAMHVNDSKAPLKSYRDLHARIGTGYLGLRAFHNLVNDERLHGLPMILETPIEVRDENGKKMEDKSIWAREIKMLERLVGMDVESEEFKKMEKDLFDEGASERERIGEQVERKRKKEAGGKAPRKRKAKTKIESEEEENAIDEDMENSE